MALAFCKVDTCFEHVMQNATVSSEEGFCSNENCWQTKHQEDVVCDSCLPYCSNLNCWNKTNNQVCNQCSRHFCHKHFIMQFIGRELMSSIVSTFTFIREANNRPVLSNLQIAQYVVDNQHKIQQHSKKIYCQFLQTNALHVPHWTLLEPLSM